MNKPICCNKEVISNDTPIEYNGGPGYGVWCSICGNKSAGSTLEDAIKTFTPTVTIQKEAIKPMNNLPSTSVLTMKGNQERFIQLASPVIGNDTSAIERLMNNNIRYVETSKHLEKLWTSQEGKESIIHATEEAMILGAELGKMGDIVPYGNSCEFIPSIEAYEFALTNGKNNPFENIEIRCIHENDIVKIGEKGGNFFCDLEMKLPRGKVIAVAVYGLFIKDGKVRGEVYDAERLMEKAAEHSTSYQYFLQDLRSFEALKAEGKILIENGREYFKKTMPKKDGTSWIKNIYKDEMTNPYHGADQPEMLRKTAGKSFCRKYARVRNAEAAMHEVKNHKQAVDRCFDLGDEIVQ